MMTDLLIVTAPFTYTFGPSLSPALLKACATQAGIATQTWDLSAEFNFDYGKTDCYKSVVSWMNHPELKMTLEEYQWYQDIVADYANTIINKYQPKNLAISLLTQNSQRFAEDLCYHIKCNNAQIKIILGGNGLDIFQFLFQTRWAELMLDGGLADAVILGEGEYALPRVINENLVGLIKEPQLTNEQLSQIPIPNYDDYDFSLYESSTQSYWGNDQNVRGPGDLIFLITASKGCVKDCSFCDVGKIWPKFRFRGAEQVADEIITLHKKYNARYFSFTDSLMNGGLKVFNDLNKILAEKIPKAIHYDGQIICRSSKDMPEHYYELMSQAGCYSVSVGMESGSEQVRMHMGKGSMQDDVYYSTEMLTKYGIKQNWNIIAGYPTETDDDWAQTMNLIRYWLPRTNNLLTISPIGTFLLLEGTPMTLTNEYDDLGMKKHIVNGYASFAWTSQINQGNTFDVRYNRFLELCKYLIEFDGKKYSYLESKLSNLEKQLTWYHNESKNKKVYNLSFN
jgi:radical SAM superfamily enzyme YgiQ (UPF0313 family)